MVLCEGKDQFEDELLNLDDTLQEVEFQRMSILWLSRSLEQEAMEEIKECTHRQNQGHREEEIP